MFSTRRARLLVALAGAVVLLGAVLLVTFFRVPRDRIVVRVTRTGDSLATRAFHASYGAPHLFSMASAHGTPLSLGIEMEVRHDGDALVAEVPLALREVLHEWHLWELRLGDVPVQFSDQGDIEPDADGIAIAHLTLHDLPDFTAFDTHGLREARVFIDARPLTTTTLRIPELPVITRPDPDDEPEDDDTEPAAAAAPVAPPRIERIRTEPDAIPIVSLCAGEHVALTFDISPWPANEDCIRAVMLRTADLDSLREARSELSDAVLPVTVTVAEWNALVANEAGARGYRGGTPTLTTERGAHTVTFWAQPGDSSRDVELSELYVAVGCFPEHAPSVRLGVVRIEVRNGWCMQ